MGRQAPLGGDGRIAAFFFVAVVAANAAVWSGSSVWWIVPTYHFVFAIGICVVLPTWYHVVIQGRSLSEIGLSADRWVRNLVFGLAIVMVTVPPRLGSIAIPPVGAIATVTAAMCMSSFFEEVFFRGFFQTHVRRAAGVLPAVLLSGIAFSFYHVGYGAEWQEPARLVQMTFVGIMFAVAFELTHSVITSFTLNLPHAIVTFIEREQYFDVHSAIASLVAVLVGVLWLGVLTRRHETLPAGRAPTEEGGLRR